jgi:hypothetical protein
VIDLHLHTTASDGRSTPDALVREVAAAGVTTMAVTDHDTTAAVAAVAAAARATGIRFVPGIEITAVHARRDVHILGYFFDPDHAELVAFLAGQRDDRRRRLLDIAGRLADLGVGVDVAAVIDAESAEGKALGRPLLAAALVAAGHVANTRDAFDRYLGAGCPAFIARHGWSPDAVVALITSAGGLASLAHPGKLTQDDIIAPLVDAGLQAIEVYHSDHDGIDVHRYLDIARHHGLLVTGGSDYHGPGSGRVDGLGRTHLPEVDFDRLVARVGWRG